MKKTYDKQYLQPSKSLYTANTIIDSNTGVTYKLTPEFKLIYFLMRDQYVFHKNLGQDYYASFQSILYQCTTLTYDRKAKRVFKMMKDLGLLICKGKNKNTCKVVLDISELPHLILQNELYAEFQNTSDVRKQAKVARLNKWKNKRIAKGTWTDRSVEKENEKEKEELVEDEAIDLPLSPIVQEAMNSLTGTNYFSDDVNEEEEEDFDEYDF